MNKSEPVQPRRVAIVGGGITGLAAAYTLQKSARESGQQVSFTLFESDARLGGKILTETSGEFVVEGGPDSFLLQKPWAAQLAQELGLENELIGTNPAQRKLYVVHRGRLTPMPDGLMLIIPTRFMPFVTSPLISWPGKLRMGLDLFIPRRTDDEDESVGAFIRRRLGREALEKIAEPMMSGIHVSDPERQSLLGTFPRFRNIERQYGSLIRGMLAQKRAARQNGKRNSCPDGSWKNSVFVTLRGGLSQLVEVLASTLQDGEIHTNCTVTTIQPEPGGGFWITDQENRQTYADVLILATPASVSARLTAPFAPELSRKLSGIRYVSTATVSLAYRRSEWTTPIQGVGFIAPRRENRRISACTMTSTKFDYRAPEDKVLVRCFIGGPGREEALDKSDAEIIADAQAELSQLLGVQGAPVLARVYRWPDGNAQYDVGHLDRVQQMHNLCADFPGLYLSGSAYEGIGIPDCIHQGQQTAAKALAFLAERLPERLVAAPIGLM